MKTIRFLTSFAVALVALYCCMVAVGTFYAEESVEAQWGQGLFGIFGKTAFYGIAGAFLLWLAKGISPDKDEDFPRSDK